MSQWYELWAKSGANPNWRVENPSEYISNLNWVKNWFSSYFFNKVSDFIFGILTILIISFLFIYKKSERKKEKNKTRLLLLSIIIIFIIWFFKFPQLRYGGYVIIANLFFLPFCYFILKNKINKKIIHSLKILTVIGLVIFAGRNINRITNEIKIYNYNPIQNAYFRLENEKFKTIILENDINLNISDGSCWATPQPCTHRSGINAIKRYNYIIYF